MNTLVSPSQIFYEKCQQMIKDLVDATDKQHNSTEVEELYEKTIDFLQSNVNLLRDMKMIVGFSYLIWILVDFRIFDNGHEKRKQTTRDLNDIIEAVLELAENEELLLFTLLRRMQIYFSMSAVYSKLKPVANVIIIEQCYLEAESIVKFIDDISPLEKKQILDLWESIKSAHELRDIHTVKKTEASNHATVNYIKCDPFEGGSLYAPSLKLKETPEYSYKPRSRRRRRQKNIEIFEFENDIPNHNDAVSETSSIKLEEVDGDSRQPLIKQISNEDSINHVRLEIKVESDLNCKMNEESTSDNSTEMKEEIVDEKINENIFDENEFSEPPEVPSTEPPELNYEPVFAPYSFITNSSLRNPPLFHPIMLPRDPSKSILPPLKIDPPAPTDSIEIPVIVRHVIAELNERNLTNSKNLERTVINPITNLERNAFNLKDSFED